MTEESKHEYRCTECDREILNRAHEECLYCGAKIPIELLFTEAEIEENEEKHKEIIEESEKRRKRNKSSISGDILGPGYSDGGEF